MPLVDRWNHVERGLDPRWTEVTLSLAINDDAARSRAAALLGPAGPGVGNKEIRFTVSTKGTGIGPEAARRLLRRIDEEGIVGRLELVETLGLRPEPEQSDALARGRVAGGARGAARPTGATSSPRSSSTRAPTSTAAPSSALRSTPCQSTGRPGFRFRCASQHGYGASAGMVGRCLARLDEAGITGRVRITRALSDVHPVGTQGATFVVGRRPA